LTIDGKLVEVTIPTDGAQPARIATGPDGALWFTEYAADQLGRIEPGAL
jgi:virginiamycin B lyase